MPDIKHNKFELSFFTRKLVGPDSKFRKASDKRGSLKSPNSVKIGGGPYPYVEVSSVKISPLRVQIKGD